MGGTYDNIRFSDRFSEHPNRRRLIPVIDPATNMPINNLYDVQREEGNVYNPGTPFNAQNMNKFSSNINGMFPVSVENGGTGVNSIQKFLNEYGLSKNIGGNKNKVTLFAKPDGAKDGANDAKFNYGASYGGRQECSYYVFGNFCIISISVKGMRVNRGGNEEEKKYLEVRNLPFNAAHNDNNPQKIYMPCTITTNVGADYNNHLFDADSIPVKSTICYLDTSLNHFIFQEPTGQKRIYVNRGTTVEINLSGVYCIMN